MAWVAFTNNIGFDGFFHLQIDVVLGECGRVEVNYRKVEFKLQPSTKVCFLVNSFGSESLQVIMSWLLSHSSGEFPESVKINETVDFVGGKPHLVPFNVTFSFSQMSPPGDLDDDIEFDDVDSEGSGSDEGDDIDGI